MPDPFFCKDQSLERSRTHNPLFPHRHTHYMSQFDLYLVVSQFGFAGSGRNENVNRLREHCAPPREPREYTGEVLALLDAPLEAAPRAQAAVDDGDAGETARLARESGTPAQGASDGGAARRGLSC